MEHAARYTERVAPFNAVVVLQIEGNLAPARLRPALDALQRRHPLLRARILERNNEFFFHFEGSGPIPVEVNPHSPADRWLTVTEEELYRPFDLAAGPLMRCRYLQTDFGGHLIVTFHHTIIDGASAKHLLNELLSLCAGQALPAGELEQEGRVPATALYPARYSGAGFIRAAAAYAARQVADEAKFRWNARGVRKAPIAEKGRCRLLPVRYSAALTGALLEASRHRRITLNAILSAGMMIAVERRLYRSPRAPFRHIIFTDLRPHLSAKVPPDELGCRMSIFRLTIVVERDGDFWSLAREVQESTLRAARSGERFLAHSMSPGMMKLILDRKPFRMGTTALSYTGALDLPASHGPFAVTGLHAFPMNFTLGPEYSALVHLFRGELWCDILYLDSDMNSAGAQQIAHDMQAILEEAAC
jgi:hypothetical protein